LDPIAGLAELGNITVWFPTIMLEENSGHGGSRCRWSEKYLVKILCVTAKKFFTSKVKLFSLRSEIVKDFVCDCGLILSKNYT